MPAKSRGSLGWNPKCAYKLMKRLGKWGVLRGVRDLMNGKLAFRPASTKATQLLAVKN